ncbi:MAG: aldehyde dehydrogenase family protein [Steroidobacteraceae bacterium]
MRLQRTISPADGSVYVERPYADAASIDRTLARAVAAQREWRETLTVHRAGICSAFCDAFEARTAELAPEISWQMGRPIAYAPGEIRGTLERARHMIEIGPQALADLLQAPKQGFERFIRREPLGVVFTVAAWNYPYLISINSVLPALLAGNAVILKHSAQTPLCAERFAESFASAGLPEGLFQVLHVDHEATAKIIGDPRVDFVAFTGSVDGGHAVQRAAAERFIGVGLELGGNDPAYVRADVDLAHAVENLVDGAFFNSGQSCCGIGRIFVHDSLYGRFVEAIVELTSKYVLGNPLDPATTLGPCVRTAAAESVRAAIAKAQGGGARGLVDAKRFGMSKVDTPYLAPQILVDVNPRMAIMREETFGPVVCIAAVNDDADAIAQMNDSRFGLTASVWTRDADAALAIGTQVRTGTFFMNRCDYLDPALAWTGVKDSGRGATLSSVGYEHLTRPKSFHLRVQT